jgi:hypothetical protein
VNLPGIRKVPGKHLLHFGGEFATQDDRVHLVVVQ